MNNNQHSYAIAITRYGLPFVVGIFYLTASLGFEFTDDSTFRVLSAMKDGGSSSPIVFPSPLWQFLLMMAGWFHLNPLLTSKVLGLVFACSTIFVTYLVASELLHDRLMAFCVSLVSGMQGWLLHMAPSGSALMFAIALTLAALFFMLRNEYVVAPFILGLSTMVFWQAAFFLIPVCIDIWMNSVSKRRSSKVIFSACLVYLSALLPWVLYAWSKGVDGFPALLRGDEIPQFSPLMLAIVSLLGALGIVGMVLSALSSLDRTEMFRSHAGVLAFVFFLALLGLLSHSDVWLASLPLAVMYAFHGLSELLKRFGSQRLLYSVSFVLTGLLLVPLQLEYYRVNKPAMLLAVERANELQVVALWLQTNVPPTLRVCAERPGIIEYYAEISIAKLQPHDGLCGDVVVTSRREMPGYDIAFRPGGLIDESTGAVQSYAVWRKK